MQRHSVASFPFIITPESSKSKPSIFELLNSKRDDVSCTGTTAKLHDRGYGSEDKKLESPRRISVSYKSLLVASPQIPKRRASTSSSINDSYKSIQSQVDKDIDSIKRSLTTIEENDGNSNTTGNENPANQNTRKDSEDPNKLPQIVVTTTSQNETSRKRKKRKKNGGKDQRNEITTIPKLNEDLDAQTTCSDESTENSDSISLGSKVDEDDWKYRLRVENFQREMTRPYTYSYFPELTSKKRKPGINRKGIIKQSKETKQSHRMTHKLNELHDN